MKTAIVSSGQIFTLIFEVEDHTSEMAAREMVMESLSEPIIVPPNSMCWLDLQVTFIPGPNHDTHEILASGMRGPT